jgi:serine/threonine protein phosphatase PrpC
MVLAEPEVTHRAVDGDFAIIACDGLYDVFSSEEAVDVVRKGLAENAGDPVRAASGVCSAAVDDRGSRDNVTAVVVALRAAAPEGIS